MMGSCRCRVGRGKAGGGRLGVGQFISDATVLLVVTYTSLMIWRYHGAGLSLSEAPARAFLEGLLLGSIHAILTLTLSPAGMMQRRPIYVHVNLRPFADILGHGSAYFAVGNVLMFLPLGSDHGGPISKGCRGVIGFSRGRYGKRPHVSMTYMFTSWS